MLEQIDTPSTPKGFLRFDQIQEVLEGDKRSYEMDPSHCSVPVKFPFKWKEDHNFDRLLTLWDKSNWLTDAAYGRILSKLADDDRFIVHVLQPKFPAAKRFAYAENPLLTREENTQASAQEARRHKDQIEEYISQLARKEKLTKQQFAAQWVRSQLVEYIQKLKGTSVVQGPRSHLKEAIEYIAKIIPLLSNPNEGVAFREDTLLRIAVEGGDYCGLAVRRVPKEVFEHREDHELDQYIQAGNMDPAERIGLLLRRKLEKKRQDIIDGAFQEVARAARGQEALKATVVDVHLYEAVSKMLKLGFLPIKESEREEYGLTDLLFLDTMGLASRAILMGMYQEAIERVMIDVSGGQGQARNNRILANLRLYVERNPLLSADQKRRLLEGALANTEENLADPDFYPKIYRLQLYLLGIYRKKAA